MRVLFLNPLAQLGGAERSLLDLLAVLRSDVELGLITLEDGPLLGAAHALGVDASVLELPRQIHEIGDSGAARLGLKFVRSGARATGPALRALRGLQRRIKQFDPDIVHSNGIKTHLLSGLAVPSGTSLVWHVRDFLSQRSVVRRVLPLVSRRVSSVFAISAAVEEDVRRVLRRVPVALVYNAVDLDRFRPRPCDADLLDRRIGLPPAAPGTVRIGLVATYARWKGHRPFLEAAAHAFRLSSLPLRFYIAGGPLYRSSGSQVTEAELRELATALGLTGSVGFVPHTDHPELLYGCFDLVAHASTEREPFGRTVIEAMACGVPVVTGSSPGALERLESTSVLRLPTISVASLAEAFTTLSETKSMRAQLSNAGPLEAAKYARKRLHERITLLYRSLYRRSRHDILRGDVSTYGQSRRQPPAQ